MRSSKSTLEVLPRLRMVRDGVIVLGPGKADLLDAIERAGSIRGAATELGMSYMRAWTLVRTMDDEFRKPLVERARGGAQRGGARLTTEGRAVLALYRKMQQRSETAIAALARKLATHLRAR